MSQKKSGNKILGLFIGLLLGLGCSSALAADAQAPGETLPGFQIKMPDSPEIGTYLGLKGAKTFALSQVPAKLLVVEFFDVFCPVCQANAPLVNRLFKFIREDKELNKNIKMLGIALENEPGDLAVYKEKFKVEFPLFPDPKKEIQTSSKVKFVPLLMVIDKNGKILMSHKGRIKEVDTFLGELRKRNKTI
jgi:peroxiredoxin